MAEGYLRLFAAGRAEVFSAGVETHGVNPRAVFVMSKDGVDISAQTSNNVSEYEKIPFDYLITVCDNANERCPVFFTTGHRFHQNFSDPAKATGTESDIIAQFELVRDQIKDYCFNFVQQRL